MKDRDILSYIEFYTLKRYGYYSSFNKQECGASLDYLSNIPLACILLCNKNKALRRFSYILKKVVKMVVLTNLKEILWEAVQVKAQNIYQIAYVYHRLYFINGKLSKIKLANKKHALAFIISADYIRHNKISRIFLASLLKKYQFKSRRNTFKIKN